MTYPKITFVDTGVSTSTGTRLNRLKPLLSQYDIFMLTYGDGISDVDIEQLYKYHCSHSCAATVTAVRPPARFGELQLEGNSVVGFQEKPSISTGRINGGFFVFNNTFFQYIPDHDVMLERDPLENAIRSNDLKLSFTMAFGNAWIPNAILTSLISFIQVREAHSIEIISCHR